MRKEPKIVAFDLETLMDMKEIAQIFPQLSNYPGLTLKASHNSIISFGYKELGTKKAKCKNAWDFPKSWNKDVNDDKELCKFAYETLKDADVVVTHNGRRFDWKFLNSRLIKHGLPRLPKITHVDTCQVAKSNLYLLNNRLNTVAKHLGCELKMQNGGWDLWVKVLNRNKRAQKTMSDYCKQDVEVLEQVFLKLRQYVTIIPNYNLFDPDNRKCPSCGSKKIHKHSKLATSTKIFQRYRCTDCGSYAKVTVKKISGI